MGEDQELSEYGGLGNRVAEARFLGVAYPEGLVLWCLGPWRR